MQKFPSVYFIFLFAFKTRLQVQVLSDKIFGRTTNILPINWQNCAQVRLQSKFAFIIRPQNLVLNMLELE